MLDQPSFFLLKKGGEKLLKFFRKILVKKPNFEVIKDEIRQAIFKIDDTLDMTSFDYTLNHKTRKLEISVVLTTTSGENISVTANIWLQLGGGAGSCH